MQAPEGVEEVGARGGEGVLAPRHAEAVQGWRSQKVVLHGIWVAVAENSGHAVVAHAEEGDSLVRADRQRGRCARARPLVRGHGARGSGRALNEKFSRFGAREKDGLF